MGAGHLLTHAVDRILEPIESIHQGVAQKWLRRTHPLSFPVRVGHDLASGLVYGFIRVGSRVGSTILDARASATAADRMTAIAGGLWGDDLSTPEAAMKLLSADGRPAPAGVQSGGVTGHIVVLVHGLMETERTWGSEPDRSGFLTALVASPLLTPVAVRYNSGLPVDDNGAHLSTLLERLYEGWPVPVESIALVGHSMGGLVARRACLVGAEARRRWITLTTDLVTIGAPHRGTTLETLTGWVARGLRIPSLTRPVGEFLDGRSRGIKDLEWGREDSSELPTGLREHFVAGVVTADPDHPVGALVGDLMVTRASSTTAAGSERASVAVVGGVNHFALLTDRTVIDQVMSWIDPEAPTPAG